MCSMGYPIFNCLLFVMTACLFDPTPSNCLSPAKIAFPLWRFSCVSSVNAN